MTNGANGSGNEFRPPIWLTFLAGMLTAAALFAGVGFGISSARDSSAHAAAITAPGTPVPGQQVPHGIVGRVVELNPAQRQVLVRDRAGRFVVVQVTGNTVFKRGDTRLTLDQVRTELRPRTPVLLLGRRSGDQFQALVVNLFPPSAPNLPALPAQPRATPSPSPRADGGPVETPEAG